MLTVINDFETRVLEIEEYYVLLNNIINNEARLFYPNKQTHRVKEFDDDLIKVLKANCFLLLYNLIESSIKSSITEIYDSISTKSITYDNAIDNVRKIWISERYKNFKNQGTDFIFSSIQNIASDIIEISFNPEKVISGNIDGRKIRFFSEAIGFSNTTHYRAKEGVKLHQVKTQRNNLAHGAISFSQCGRQYTFDDLHDTKQEVIIHLRGILKNIKKYIDNDTFIE